MSRTVNEPLKQTIPSTEHHHYLGANVLMSVLGSEIFLVCVRRETQAPEQFLAFQTSKSYKIICLCRHDAAEIHAVRNKQTRTIHKLAYFGVSVIPRTVQAFAYRRWVVALTRSASSVSISTGGITTGPITP